MNRRDLLQTTSTAAALVIGIALLLNAFSRFVHLRLDLSQGRVYSMSAATKRLVNSLPDPVTIKLYASRELPPQVASARDYARDLLEEYKTASGGKVRVQFFDTDADPKAKQDAGKDGIMPVQFQIYSNDKFEVRDGFLGISLQYRDKREGIPYLQEVTGLEYDLTSRIKTMTLAEMPSLGFVTNHRAQGLDTLDPSLGQRLAQRYRLKPVDLGKVPDDGVPAEFQTLLIIGPEEKFTDRELWLLDQFLLSGRSLGVAVDTKRVDMRTFTATDEESGLTDFLAKHGVGVLSTLVFDQQSQPIQISVQQGIFAITNVVPFPPFVKATNLSSLNPVTKGLDSIVVPFASPLKVTAPKAEVLVKSSPYSWAKPDKTPSISLHPFKSEPAGPDDLRGPFDLAVVLDGEFKPAFDKAPKGVKAKTPLAKAERPGRLAVVGSSRFMAQAFRVPPTNAAFSLNLMDWLALDAELIAIRNKAVAFRPLREIPQASKALVRWTLILAPPWGVVALGLWAWARRRSARSRRMADYGAPPSAAAPPSEPPAPAEPAPAA
ncbi:MAG: GldG family protein [Elusimicrobia bacterium]|nr:GldG family protein [Elusimicrobiota bacterium]